MTCSNCGFLNDPDAEFCENCGTALPRVCAHCGSEGTELVLYGKAY